MLLVHPRMRSLTLCGPLFLCDAPEIRSEEVLCKALEKQAKPENAFSSEMAFLDQPLGENPKP